MPIDANAVRLEALLLLGTLRERLGLSVGYPATVYLKGVHAQLLLGMPPAPGMPGSPASGVPGTWCPPGPTPGPGPGPSPGHGGTMMGTAVLNGVLAFAGADYINLHVPMAGASYREVLIPYNAIGMILPGGPVI